MATEDQNIQALADALQRNQEIEIGIQGPRSAMQQIITQYATIPSLYTDPAKLDALIRELEDVLERYVARANARGSAAASRAIADFMERAERRQLTTIQLDTVLRANARQVERRLALYVEELSKEAEILRRDIRIFIKNAQVAGFTQKQILSQLIEAANNKAGPVDAFAKRSKRVAALADRREVASAEIEKYRTMAKPGELWQWITVSTRPCPDCQPRAGKVFPYSEWVKLGIPGAGRTICGPACRCKLLPITVAEDMFPTVKEFTWNRRSTVLATAGELRRFEARKNQPPQNQ